MICLSFHYLLIIVVERGSLAIRRINFADVFMFARGLCAARLIIWQ